MKILFCKISSMKYYKGHCIEDMPRFGGEYVDENGFGHEEYNFMPIPMEDEDGPQCVGFVEPKSNRGVRNTLHLENIDGCRLCAKEECVSGVLVVWCAKREIGMTRSGAPKYGITVVGWYKNACVWRDLQGWVLVRDGAEEERCFNVMAAAEDCVLLPDGRRNWHGWNVPLAKNTKTCGFGQAMVWYAAEPQAQDYVQRLVQAIEEYSGENWLNEYPG